MKRLIVFVLVFSALFVLSIGIVSADPEDNPNKFIVSGVECENGWSGDVLVPSHHASAGFVGDIGIGIVRANTTVAESTGDELFVYEHPGNGYDTTTCEFEEFVPDFYGEGLDETLLITVEVQIAHRGN